MFGFVGLMVSATVSCIFIQDGKLYISYDRLYTRFIMF